MRTAEINKRTCLITGATSGIGKATAHALASMGYGVILFGRNEEKLRRTCREIRTKSDNSRISSYVCDLSVMKDVHVAADRLKNDYETIDILVNNTGARFLRHELTQEGIEMTLATNHLGHFVLTSLLIDLLNKSGRARVINISSGVHYSGNGIIRNILFARDYDGRKQYADSKLANVLFTYALANKVAGSGITVNSCEPGGVATNFARNNGFLPWLKHRIYYLRKGKLLTPAKGAETVVFLASSDDVSRVTGKHFFEKKEIRSSDQSYDRKFQDGLWSLSQDLTGIDFQG